MSDCPKGPVSSNQVDLAIIFTKAQSASVKEIHTYDFHLPASVFTASSDLSGVNLNTGTLLGSLGSIDMTLTDPLPLITKVNRSYTRYIRVGALRGTFTLNTESSLFGTIDQPFLGARIVETVYAIAPVSPNSPTPSCPVASQSLSADSTQGQVTDSLIGSSDSYSFSTSTAISQTISLTHTIAVSPETGLSIQIPAKPIMSLDASEASPYLSGSVTGMGSGSVLTMIGNCGGTPFKILQSGLSLSGTLNATFEWGGPVSWDSSTSTDAWASITEVG